MMIEGSVHFLRNCKASLLQIHKKYQFMYNKGKEIVGTQKVEKGDYATKVVYTWNPSQPSRVKINIDASFYKETDIAGLRIIARDEI